MPAPTVTTTQASPQQQQKPDSKDEPWLTPTQRVVAIIVGLIAIVAALWKLPRKIIFSTLESATGRKELVDIVHQQLDSAAGRAALAGYVLGHFELDAGRTEFRKFVLSILTADEAEEPMRKLVTRLIVLREESKEKVEEHREALRIQMLAQKPVKPTTREVELKNVEIESSKLGELGAEPAAYQEEINALFRKIAAHLGMVEKPKDAPAGEPEDLGRKKPDGEPS